MRQLSKGQRLQFVGTPDITNKVVSRHPVLQAANASSVQSQHVMQWVMDNTVQDTLYGVLPWCRQGRLWAETGGTPSIQDELLGLEELYGAKHTTCDAAELVMAHQDGRATQAMVLSEIRRRGEENGRGHSVVVRSAELDEECEREMEKEEEEEEEREQELPAVEAANEEDWDYAAAFAARSPAELPSDAGVMKLPQVCRRQQRGAGSWVGVAGPGMDMWTSAIGRHLQLPSPLPSYPSPATVHPGVEANLQHPRRRPPGRDPGPHALVSTCAHYSELHPLHRRHRPSQAGNRRAVLPC